MKRSALILTLTFLQTCCMSDQLEVYIGTKPSEGISSAYVCTFDSDSGKLGEPVKIENSDHVRIVTTHGNILIGAGAKQTGDKKRRGNPVSLVNSFTLSEGLRANKPQLARGGICALDVYAGKEQKYVAAADFPGGSVMTFPLNDDGSIGPVSCTVQHKSASPPAGKRKGPRAHDIKFTKDGKAVMVADLGLQQVIMYRFDPSNGKLEVIGKLQLEDRGPRHLAFHPTLPIAYVNNQRGGTVVAFSYDTTTGKMEFKKRVSTLPVGYEENNHCADIHVHPSAKFLYASNRGHNSLAMYRLDAKGMPTTNGYIPTGGEAPWSFAITPNGKYLIVSNLKTDDVRVFSIDADNGTLSATDQVIHVPGPISVALRRLSQK